MLLPPPGFQFCGASQGRRHFLQFRLRSPSMSSMSDAAGGHKPWLAYLQTELSRVACNRAPWLTEGQRPN
jgi:hypothetical protein